MIPDTLLEYMAGFELDKQNQFAKKDSKNFFDLRNIL